jgi:hypothetical protein
MKFDMHCHTKEGSIDAKLPIAEYIEVLKSKGFDGMLISDHDTYNGYRKYRDNLKGKINDFVVLKGIEYDTLDAGHILIIMPEGVKLLLMECRGLPVKLLQDIVHKHGVILGPAHPGGGRHMSISGTRVFRRNPDIMRGFDFLEGFNSCESPESNAKAMELAARFNLPTFGGSDAHRADCAGMAYTEFAQPVTSESELIRYIKTKPHVECGGDYYNSTLKGKIGIFSHLMPSGFWVYNRAASVYTSRKRKRALSLLRRKE